MSFHDLPEREKDRILWMDTRKLRSIINGLNEAGWRLLGIGPCSWKAETCSGVVIGYPNQDICSRCKIDDLGKGE